VTIWKLRNNNPLRKSYVTNNIKLNEFDALIRITVEMSKYLYPYIREILKSKEDIEENSVIWNDFNKRFIELIKERFNLERKIFNNEINIADIPDAWNDEFNRLFNLSINKDTDGCLQDIHWFAGLFGYFPTYSLGALTAAQFASQLRTDQKELDQEIENGEFSNLVNWLKKNIHEKASFFSTNEVLEQVTKSPLNAKYFKEYITNRYL